MNAEKLTQYPELDGVLQDHAERLQDALGDFLVGVYLEICRKVVFATLS